VGLAGSWGVTVQPGRPDQPLDDPRPDHPETPADELEVNEAPDADDVDRTGGGTVYTEVPPEGEDETRDQSLTPDVPTVLPPPVLTGPGETVLVEAPAELADDEPADGPEPEAEAPAAVRLEAEPDDDEPDDDEPDDDEPDDDEPDDDEPETEQPVADDGFDAFAPVSQEPSPQLLELAKAYGVQTEFHDWQGKHSPVSRRTVVAVLRGLDVDASTDDGVERALLDVQERPWRQLVPPVVVVRQGAAAKVPVHVPHGTPVQVWVELEEGGRRVLEQDDHVVEPRKIDGVEVGEATFTVPADLPLGWHRLHARHEGGEAERPLVVTPECLELPPALEAGRSWGFMTQLYSVRSRFSWGLGDLADLAEIADWSARDHGAGFVLVNPLHAAEPVPPMEPSPYLPTTRRFVNPVYLRVEDIREVGYMPSTDRALVEWQAEAMRGLNQNADPLDRDAVWTAKKSALETVFEQPRSRARQARFEAFCAREGEGLVDFATW